MGVIVNLVVVAVGIALGILAAYAGAIKPCSSCDSRYPRWTLVCSNCGTHRRRRRFNR